MEDPQITILNERWLFKYLLVFRILRKVKSNFLSHVPHVYTVEVHIKTKLHKVYRFIRMYNIEYINTLKKNKFTGVNQCKNEKGTPFHVA